MTISDLNFEELLDVEESPGRGLQDLVTSIGETLGFEVEAGGHGADRGRDAFFKRTLEVIPGLYVPFKILVNCKDRTKSGKQLKFDELGNFPVRVDNNGCNAFLLVSSIPVTDDVVTGIRDAALESGFASKVWQPSDLKRILLENQDNVFKFTIARFFPKAFRLGQPFDPSFESFLNALELLEYDDVLEQSLKFLQNTTDPIQMWECLRRVIALPSVSIEDELFEHFLQGFQLENKELTSSLMDELYEPVSDWGLSQENWEDIYIHDVDSTSNSQILLKVSGTTPEYVGDGYSRDDERKGFIVWDQGGFSVGENTDDWNNNPIEYVDYDP